MKFYIAAAVTLVFATSAALAQERDEDDSTTQATQASEQDADVAEEAEDDRGSEVVCRTERVTGSLTRRTRTCLTRDEWDDVHSRTRNEMDRMGRNASGGKECRQDQFGGC
ncbi:hypothetical protein [Alteraurantiacibacter aquimixticola]|uniref:Secreted protein n=1 Tax=Alteraurantiacibacter aquimixticola TaxID=2489173 RepID=A0A4T3EZH1_9SPHN|nr:hypothetical protein [Alteraurantiacibacter aquimixticola]TIX50162.1 hypothetical protein E5222_07660 [Alteraurantiacibacter aquimixticola]